MTTSNVIQAVLIALLGGGGVYFMLPHRRTGVRPDLAFKGGAQAAFLALVLFFALIKPIGDLLTTTFFDLFAFSALVAGVLMVTARDPVHSALWFAGVVLSTGGLFLLAGASFLAAGTVIVYAGAIIVTFLFVIMLAQMEGRAPYDRAAHAPGPAVLACFLLMACLLSAVAALKPSSETPVTTDRDQIRAELELPRAQNYVERFHLREHSSIQGVIDLSIPSTSRLRNDSGELKPHVAGLGEALYTDHLISAGLSGVLLFVALVAAVVIANPRPPAAAGRRALGPPTS